MAIAREWLMVCDTCGWHDFTTRGRFCPDCGKAGLRQWFDRVCSNGDYVPCFCPKCAGIRPQDSRR